MKVAMFEGLSRKYKRGKGRTFKPAKARSATKHCGKGRHVACIKNSTKRTSAQTRFAKAAKACKNLWKKKGTFLSRRNAYNKCISTKTSK
ncbi:MAG: hypothetical protein KJ648_07250 [Candidatus Omnitrophica bacterium]|nr:hypothetical protein [Candidatus Omnitrophota bacterium]MBU1767880.1 hypothetical protein [Candidatus Omnitrophota bacterium]